MQLAKGEIRCCCAALAMGWGALAAAQDLPITHAAAAQTPVIRMAPGEAWPAVGDSRLDRTRGGFDDGNGLLASFGLARQVFVNGNLVASSSVRIPDVAHVTPAQADALAAAVGTVNVIQIGPGNSFDPAALRQTGGATVIQNTLDNQNIQSLTTLDASVNNLNLFHSLNLQDSLQTGLVHSRGQ